MFLAIEQLETACSQPDKNWDGDTILSLINRDTLKLKLAENSTKMKINP